MKKIIWIIVVAVIVLLAWYFGKDLFFGTQKEDPAKTGSGSGGSGSASSKPVTLATTQSFPIKYGDKSQSVLYMQRGLNSRFGENLTLDGIYGNMTKQALLDHDYDQEVSFSEFCKIIGTEYTKWALNNVVKVQN